jgi:hypothetical protein
MSSIRRIQASRVGGKLSRRKANTPRNPLRHGFFAKAVPYSDESSAAFRRLHDRYITRFCPSGPGGRDRLYEMAAASRPAMNSPQSTVPGPVSTAPIGALYATSPTCATPPCGTNLPNDCKQKDSKIRRANLDSTPPHAS